MALLLEVVMTIRCCWLMPSMLPVPRCSAADCSCAAAQRPSTCFLHPRTQLQALKAGAQPISTELAGIVFEDGDDDATTLQKAAAVDYVTLGGQRRPAAPMQLRCSCRRYAAVERCG